MSDVAATRHDANESEESNGCCSPPPNVWLHDLWTVGLVADAAEIRDSNGTPACVAYLCGVECRRLLHKNIERRCKLSHDLEAQLTSDFRNLHIKKLREAGGLALKRERRGGRENAQPPEAQREPSAQLPVPDWIRPYRQELVSTYDTSKYRLRELVAAVLECNSLGLDALEQLHTDASYEWLSRWEEVFPESGTGEKTPRQHIPLNPKLVHSYQASGRKLSVAWKRAMRSEKRLFNKLNDDARWQAFLDGVEQFCQMELLPLCCGPDRDQQLEGMMVQFPPTLRIQMPGRQPSINMHVDTDYAGHQEAECNFWVPLTNVFGNNTLWAESEPMKGDFRPFELSPSEFLRFEGVKCRHFTKANDTNVTRVSFDLRAVPLQLWRDLYGGRIGDYGCKLILPPHSCHA